MAEQKVWIGSVGPFLYDDTDMIDDVDGDLPTATHSGLVTTGQMIVSEAPSTDDNVLRMQDVTETASLPYVEGDLSLAVTGISGTITAMGKYIKIGRLISFTIKGFNGTSNSTSFSLSPIPTLIRPSSDMSGAVYATDSGVGLLATYVIVPGGNIVLYKTPGVAASWTASGVKGINSLSITYIQD